MLLKRKPTSFDFQWILISLLLGGVEMQVKPLRTYYLTVGLAFKLQCNRIQIQNQNQNVSVTWSHNLDQKLENISGITVRGDALWFLPAQPFHRGNYSCLSRQGKESWVTVFNISVENASCPRMNRENAAQSTGELTCVLGHVFQLDPQAHVTWLKNCNPLNGTDSKVLPMKRSPRDEGLYTCFVNFTFEGQNYSAAQTTKIYIVPTDFVVTQPKVIFPQQDKLKVTLGKSYDLKCKALVGKNGKEETFLNWLRQVPGSSGIFPHTSEPFFEGDYMLSTLHLSEITAEDFDANFTCVIEHPAGTDFGTVTLIPDNERYFWIIVGLISASAGLLILAAVGFSLFKVDLVLAYRGLCSPVTTHTDGKSYDAYISYLHGDELGLSSTMTFALQSLPAALEELYGYKLFISGRDELPGEAVHDAVADRMNRSRRLIIVLTSRSFESRSATQNHTEPLLSHSDPSVTPVPSAAGIWGTYEQRVGLYDALVKEGLKVILVQVEDGVDENSLPESLQYISRTKGILRWRAAADGANRKFWKHLRYQMPPAQRRKSAQMTELRDV
ncbi:interleukin-1 receptor type 1 [Triplophysa rosa]|uniref:Interleukin-1 receptor I n=1 Tax=Triplophysa rosa TaxID=992332 RepID=A0A9W7WV47_TRIRA|nr:interleukin-1 receptor type 1 [Triplophysa rosa]KAI7808788.1 interleukin-1 receptor I [Triplophysa rosa]